ncbi:MAG TPA: aminoacyl-tRNA hydrolase [Candidatus Acidoferrum sp.]|jgi:PTH1 family peptidyl-tRNA hydrolase|nr:aminoacyl-tRNA hydrolase [Candidatus Acidoferrum sp.]
MRIELTTTWPKIVVGLGNPGKEYERTRHNAGFMVVDELASRYGLTSWKTKDSARQIYDSQRRVVLVEPTSFMNLSGTPVRLISSWYRTPPEGILVVVDDMDLPFGSLRMRPFGGHGGHNGLRSIIATIGDRFPRLRIGVGRPEFESVDHVLSAFNPDERAVLPHVIGAAADGVQRWLDESLEAAMQFVNNWVRNAE